MNMNNASSDSQLSPQVFYEVAMSRLDAQMNRMEAIDRKLASVIGFASVIIAVFAAALQFGGVTQPPVGTIVLLGLAGATYIVLMVFAVRAYKFMKWSFRPNLRDLHLHCKRRRYDDLTMRYWVARECLISYVKNEKKLLSKTSAGRKAMWLLAAETILLVIAVFLALVCST